MKAHDERSPKVQAVLQNEIRRSMPHRISIGLVNPLPLLGLAVKKRLFAADCYFNASSPGCRNDVTYLPIEGKCVASSVISGAAPNDTMRT